MIIFIVAFVILLVIGVPISISIGASAVLGCLSLGYPMVVIGQKMVSGIDSFLLIAVPLFILAGNLMNASKLTKKMFDTAKELVGWIPGGLAHANVLVSMVFAGISGSSQADTSGVGKIFIPAMEKQGYDKDYAVAVENFACICNLSCGIKVAVDAVCCPLAAVHIKADTENNYACHKCCNNSEQHVCTLCYRVHFNTLLP
jgi:TRAP-type mannitol/chloroaromatic compound transport system permease large subunit